MIRFSRMLSVGNDNMTNYEKAVVLWQRRNITNDAELAQALNGYSIAFAYHGPDGHVTSVNPVFPIPMRF